MSKVLAKFGYNENCNIRRRVSVDPITSDSSYCCEGGTGGCAVLKVTINPLVVADPREYLLDAVSRAYLKF